MQVRSNATSGNPIIPGTYADPEARVFGDRYWIYPTYSAPFDEQTCFDAFWSTDLVSWHKVENVLDTRHVRWAHRALWAPTTIERNGKYYMYFCANDIQSDEELGGIGVAVADTPSGPFVDVLGEPLIGQFHHGAQPIDPHVFLDDTGEAYLFFGGWRHCIAARLADDMTRLIPFEDGLLFKEVTPQGYVEAPCMLKRKGQYYFMWSEGDWAGPEYRVAYAVASSPLGPFNRRGIILEQNSDVARGAGHHGFLNIPNTDEWVIAYHRRPLETDDPHHCILCLDQLRFDADGDIVPVNITFEGVHARPLPPALA